jgi:transposase
MAAARLASHQKKAKQDGAEVAFLDEVGHSFQAQTGTTWAPEGETPILRRMSQRREVSTIFILTWPGCRLLARHFVGSIHGAEVVVALRYFQRQVRRPLTLVWDRLAAHRSKLAQAFLAAHAAEFSQEWLPPYAPDINPCEQCNSLVKREMENTLPPSVEAMRTQVRHSFRRLGHRKDTLRNFFHHAGLGLN